MKSNLRELLNYRTYDYNEGMNRRGEYLTKSSAVATGPRIGDAKGVISKVP